MCRAVFILFSLDGRMDANVWLLLLETGQERRQCEGTEQTMWRIVCAAQIHVREAELLHQPGGNKDDIGHVGRHAAFYQHRVAQHHMVVPRDGQIGLEDG